MKDVTDQLIEAQRGTGKELSELRRQRDQLLSAAYSALGALLNQPGSDDVKQRLRAAIAAAESSQQAVEPMREERT